MSTGNEQRESTTNLPAAMPFIMTTDVGKIGPKTRRLIRSHVMQGKNQGKSRKVQVRHAKHRDLFSLEATSSSNTSPEELATSSNATPCSFIPGKVGSEISLIQFADAMQPYMIEVVLDFCRMVKKIMFPLEKCLAFSTTDKVGLEPMSRDAAYLHSTVLMAQTYFDCISGRGNFTLWPTATLHASKALKLLRTRLSLEDDSVKISDMTVSVVLALAIHAQMMGDHTSTEHHMRGLRRIVDLRGGLANFEGYHGKLLLEILRCDIGSALHTGNTPFFFKDPFWEPLMPHPDLLHVAKDARMSALDFAQHHISQFDIELVKAWDTMQNFCCLMNLAAKAERRLPPEIHLNTMAAVMYRLLSSAYQGGSVDEAFRLGVLAFCTHVFLRWQNIRLPYSHLATSYKDCLDILTSTDHFSLSSLLWLLTIGNFAVSSKSDDGWWKRQLRSCIEQCGIDSWTGMRDIVKSFLWIDVLHDKAGNEFFEAAWSIP